MNIKNKLYKTIIFLFLIYTKFAFSNVIYDKNEITITNIELNEFVLLYKNNLNAQISNNEAIKKIVLIKNIVSYLSKNNPDLLNQLNNDLYLEFGNSVFDLEIRREFLIFLKIRNDFIKEYYNYNFNQNDMKIILLSLKDLILPISSDKCLIIEEVVDLRNNNFFIENFYNNLINKTNNFKVEINNRIFDVCINQKSLKKIDNLIVNYIDKKIEKKFKEFVYSKKN